MHNKILIKTGFYLLLLFAFSVTVYPPVSYFLAAAILFIWLLDTLIFRETKIVELPLFYPLMAFTAYMILAWILSAIYGHIFPFVYVALLSLFYLIVPAFITASEQRRMVIWTLIAGAMLIAGLNLIFWWATGGNLTLRLRPLPQPRLFTVTLAFSFLLALYAESSSLSEKIFMVLVALPLAAVIVLSGDKTAILFMVVAIFLVGILRDITVFIPFALAVFFLFSGVFGIDYYFMQSLSPGDYKSFLVYPISEIKNYHDVIVSPLFFGQAAPLEISSGTAVLSASFLLNLLVSAGPPAILLFLWILFERAREAYFKRRRAATPQLRAYHLMSLITIAAMIVMNLYGSVFEFPSAILACWLILGMFEI